MIISRFFHILPFIFVFVLALLWYLFYKATQRKEFLNTAIGFDQTGNAMFGGNPDHTVSGRLGKKIRDKDCKWCKIVCGWLSWFFNEDYHCIKSIEDDEK